MSRNCAVHCLPEACALSRRQARFALSISALLLLGLSALAPRLFGQTEAKPHRKVLVVVQPEYPLVVRNGHFEGVVRLDATVLANGTVSKVEVRGGNPILAQFASRAVMKWKYAPAPSSTVEEVTFNFKPD
jgi:TonB family protein